MPWWGRPSEGALGYAGVSGGLGQGLGEGYSGEGGLLAEGEFGNFDFPAISGHFGPLYLTVGGGCSVRVGFAALRSGLVAVIRHLTRSGLSWTLRILSGISEGICNTMVQSDEEFLYIGVGGR